MVYFKRAEFWHRTGNEHTCAPQKVDPALMVQKLSRELLSIGV